MKRPSSKQKVSAHSFPPSRNLSNLPADSQCTAHTCCVAPGYNKHQQWRKSYINGFSACIRLLSGVAWPWSVTVVIESVCWGSCYGNTAEL